MLYLKRTKKLK